MSGAGGAQRLVLPANTPKKAGARSARALTRGQNILVEFKEAVTLSRIFSQTGIFRGFSLLQYSKRGAARLRWAGEGGRARCLGC
jgi:hypothetical protein